MTKKREPGPFKRIWCKKLRWATRMLAIVCLMIPSVEGYAQTKRVTLEARDLPVNEVLRMLGKEYGKEFFFSDTQVDMQQRVSVSLDNVTLDEALQQIFPGKEVRYEEQDDYVMIVSVRNKADAAPVQISGVVRDEGKLPLPGVTVMIKGTQMGASTDMDGKYRLTLPPRDMGYVLVFSMIGMKTQEIAYAGQEEINVTMVNETTEMEEVVVTGMFTRRAESFTGSAQTFKKEDIMRVGNQNLLKSLSNLDPAFRIQENLELGSNPNAMPEIQMRGQTSFQGEYEGNPNQPLFILDGFETTVEKVYDLDMNRVESITLLKDAAAKAIYGSKAANGVVVIETTRPKSGEMRVYYSGDFGIEAPDLTGYNLMNAAEKLAYETQIGMYSYNTHPDIITAYESYKKVYDDVVRGVDTYWLSQPLRTGFSHKHSLTLEGGDARMRYQLGISYNKVAGVMKKSDRNTLNLFTTLSYTYNDLIFRNTIEFTRNWANNSPYGDFSEYTSMNPYWAPYDEDGNLVQVFTVHSGGTDGSGDEEVYNPLYNATLNTKDESGYTEVRDNFSVDWNISQAFRARGSFSYSRQDNTSDVFYPANHTMFAHYDENGLSDRKGQYTKGNGYTENVDAQAGLNFNKTWDRHFLFFNLTWNMATSRSNSTTVVAEGFGNDFMDDISFATQYEYNGSPSGSNSKSREVGFIGALNYSYGERYLFDASLRRSASSIYGSNSRWGTFWSLGLGWNLHHEAFMANCDWLEVFKVRGSVGYTGSQNSNPSQARARYEYLDYAYDNKLGAQLMAIPNNNLQWQRTLDWNVGVDLTLKRFLTLKADYYIQTTDNLLSDISLPPSTGFATYKENFGQTENRGYEVSLLITPWRNDEKQGYFTISLNGIHNKNKLKDIADVFANANEEANDALDADRDGTVDQEENLEAELEQYTKPATLYYEGCSMTAIWGVRSLGIDPASGQEMYLTKDGRRTFTWSSADQVIIGDTEPKLSGTIGLNFGYKGFTASLLCNYKFGGDLYNSDLIARVENVTGKENLDKRIWEAWQEPGDVAPYRVTRITGNSGSLSTDYTKPTSRFVQKNNELYISSVNLGYDFYESKWLKKCSLERLKVSFYMNELLRLSSIDIERGTSYPFARNFSLSIQATF